MPTSITDRATARVASARPHGGTKSMPPPSLLTGPQLRELESELRHELAALERRLINQRTDESLEAPDPATGDGSVPRLRAIETAARRDAVREALTRLGAGTYGNCARCAAPIPFGRLLAMPEVTHCLSCNG
jgi:DnaK suppressor protein